NAWIHYAASFDKNWMKLDTSRLAAMKKWSAEELHSTSYDGSTVFYPFAGPDALHAVTLFPNAGTYVLVGLEPVGTIPDVAHMTSDNMDQFFTNVNGSLQEALSFSFFKTNNMKVDLNRELGGVLPILMIFLVRTGNRIENISFVELSNA